MILSEKLGRKVLNIPKFLRIGYWNVGIVESPINDIMESDSVQIRWMRHKYKDRFFADPFLFKSNSDYYYIFAEEYEFAKKKGIIVLLKINRSSMRLEDKITVIDDSYHLSYPFFEGNYIIAENYKSGRLSKFTLDLKELKATNKEIILDVPLIDPTIVTYNGKKWLFGTTKEKVEDANSKLSIYFENNNKFVPHKKNPVKTDIHTARPGGNFFWYKDSLYRPAQSCEKMYGEHINIMKVTCLTEDSFEEEFVKSINSHNSDRFNLCLHTFNSYTDFAVVDGYEYSAQIRQRIKGVIQEHKKAK